MNIIFIVARFLALSAFLSVSGKHTSSLKIDDVGLIGRIDALCSMKKLTKCENDLCAFFEYIRGHPLDEEYHLKPDVPHTLVENLYAVCSEDFSKGDIPQQVVDLCDYYRFIGGL